MRESRTYGSVRGACDETHVPTATAARLHHAARRRGGVAARGAAAWPLAARAQQGERMQRIGVLIAGLTENDSEGQLRMAAFRRGLQNLGWIEGRNVHIEERWPGGNNKRLQSFAGMRPDAIFAGNKAATMALQPPVSR